jgi:O-antigen/teichoic acid export membrane protein
LNNKHARSSTWLIVDKIIRSGVNFFVSIAVINYLGSSGYGVFSYTQSIIFVFLSISSLGLDSIIVKRIVNDIDDANIILNKFLTLKLMSGLLAAVSMVSFFIIQNINKDVNVMMFGVISSISIVFSSVNIFDLYFQSVIKGKYSAIAGFFTVVLSSVIKLFFIFFKVDLTFFSLCFIFESLILICVLFFFMIKKENMALSFFIDLPYFKSLLKESWPLFISCIVVAISMRLDQFLIRTLLSFEDVGIYSASVKISESWLFVPMAIANAYFPSMINSKKISEKAYLETMRLVYSMVIYAGVGFALFIHLFGEVIVNKLYGYEFEGVYNILKIHAWTGLFSGLLVVSGKWYINEGFVKLALLRNLCSLFIGLLMNCILIPMYGLEGAAYSILVSIICSSLLFDLLGNKTRKQFFLKLNSTLIFKSIRWKNC